MTPDASARASDALISPSAAITWTWNYLQALYIFHLDDTFALAALPASASAAMVLLSCSGSRASFLNTMISSWSVQSILHLHSLHQDAPGSCSLVQETLHAAGDALSLTEDLVKILGSQDVSQSCLSQHLGGVMRVLNISNRNCSCTTCVDIRLKST